MRFFNPLAVAFAVDTVISVNRKLPMHRRASHIHRHADTLHPIIPPVMAREPLSCAGTRATGSAIYGAAMVKSKPASAPSPAPERPKQLRDLVRASLLRRRP
jgi:hypothetical protein